MRAKLELESVRVDKWLWAARLFKSRTVASLACEAGHVKVAGRSAKPSRALRRGERVLCQTPQGIRILEVVELAEKRGPASFARTLYVDHSPPRPPRGEEPLLEVRDKGAGRPTKRDRRLTERLRGRRRV